MKNFLLIFSSLFLISCNTETKKDNIASEHEIIWQNFTQNAFEQAKESNKLVFLEVGANWCHWCHVMDDSTYSDVNVQVYLNEHFVLCREDQDARPDLYAAYKPWGWPAIIILNENGEELLKLRGYQRKKKFLKALKNVFENPVPLVVENGSLASNFSESDRVLFNRYINNLDYKKGGYNWNNKSLEQQGILHGLLYYARNDSLKKWTDLTVNNSYLLVDPVWSGVYQYSGKKSWNNQHYEKLLRKQAEYIVAYCQYADLTATQKPINVAEGIFEYCNRFLGNETPLFWNSQNADLISGVHSGEYYALNETDRLAKGEPSVDKKVYLKENVSICISLTKLWAATGNEAYLTKGTEMLTYMLANYKNTNGIYSREKDEGNIQEVEINSFEDNRKLLDALIIYYQITRNTAYLKEAISLGFGLIKIFDSPKGIKSATGNLAIAPVLVPKSNVEAVLTFNLLGHLTKLDTFKNYAVLTYDRLNKKNLASSQTTLPLLFRAATEIKKEPYHAVLISDGSEIIRDAYLSALLLNPDSYFIFEELIIGKMNKEDEDFYGSFESGTLFMCTSSFCSAPISTVKSLREFLVTNNGKADF